MKRDARKVERRDRRRTRIRARLRGSQERPRLSVFRSLNHIYAQAIDDDKGTTLVQACTLDEGCSVKTGGNLAAAKAVGELVAQRLKEKGFETVVFDRGGFPYHGRIKALAEAARAKGLKF
jgi:large subunit ribosomal protein L18